MRLFSRRSPEIGASGISKPSGNKNIPHAATEAQEQTAETRIEKDCNAKRTDIPRTEDEAREHIISIRADRGLDGPSKNTEDLEAALAV